MQLTFINQRANMQDFTRSIDIPPRGDEYDGIRREYGDMLKNQLQKGNNGLTKRKYITFGIEADDLRTAKCVWNALKRMCWQISKLWEYRQDP